ncbi:hypothetical protein ACQ5R2_08465, partial [Limosilactobacillus fermentum]
KDLSMTEAEDASSVIRQAANTNVDITFGMAIDETLNDEIRVTVIATGIDKTKQGDEKPVEEVSQPAAQPESSPKCWCKLNSANLSFHKLKHTGFF